MECGRLDAALLLQQSALAQPDTRLKPGAGIGVSQAVVL